MKNFGIGASMSGIPRSAAASRQTETTNPPTSPTSSGATTPRAASSKSGSASTSRCYVRDRVEPAASSPLVWSGAALEPAIEGRSDSNFEPAAGYALVDVECRGHLSSEAAVHPTIPGRPALLLLCGQAGISADAAGRRRSPAETSPGSDSRYAAALHATGRRTAAQAAKPSVCRRRLTLPRRSVVVQGSHVRARSRRDRFAPNSIARGRGESDSRSSFVRDSPTRVLARRAAAQGLALDGAALVVAQPGLVVREEHLAGQVTAASDAGLLEDVLQVLLHRVR